MKLLALEYNVIVKPDKVEERSPGGIILTPQITDRDQFAVQTGEIVSLSPHAFTYAEWPEDARKPQVGDRVLFGQYKGADFGKGDDLVRILKDQDITAIIEDEAAPAVRAVA